ncbi:GDP-mannose 4,6-dehydratase [Candidatus Poribacteria bacterium]
MTWKGKNILITGATHFIAGHLAERLVMLGSNVKAFVRYDYQNNRGSLDRLPVHIANRVEVFHGSLTNPEAIDFVARNTDIVFHFGALDMLPLYINARDYLEKTIIGTFNVLNAVKQHEMQRLIHISTAEVYGRVMEMPISEESSLKAQSPHISSDIGAEKLVEGFYLSYNLPVTTARLFNTYGPMQSKGAIVPTIITQGVVGTKILLGNMHPIRDFIYVEDVVSGLIRMAEAPGSIGEAINLGSGQGISVGDLAERIMALIGTDIEILFDATRIRPQNSDMEQLIADITKANELLGWQPETSLDSGLEQTIEWFAEHVRV